MQKSILVVEDESALLSAVKIKLEDAGFKVIVAETVDKALNIFKEGNKVDLIWLDHYLPGKNGLDFIVTLKGDDKYKNIPVFLVSNSAGLKDVYSYVNLGIDKYYVKMDSSISEIVSAVKNYLEDPEANRSSKGEIKRGNSKALF